MRKLIYVVEDDAALQELYTYTLENEYDCVCFDSWKPFSDAMEAKAPHLIILDIMLPGDDGLQILGKLKQAKETSKIPIIMVSAKGEEISKVKGLNMGADDYITKPFGVLELAARIKAALRKTPQQADVLVYSDIEIDSSKHQISVKGKPVQMTHKEYNLLCYLCENGGVALEREAIFKKVWGEDFMGETRTLDIHIKELRKKLAAAESTAQVKTIRKVGYILT